MELAPERGAPNWLTTLPIDEFGFCLHKGAFADALALRYGWPPSHIPAHCGATFSVQHTLYCPRGGFPMVCHNLNTWHYSEFTNRSVPWCSNRTMLTNTHWWVLGGSFFQYIAVNGFWGSRFERTYLDVWVFNPLAVSNRSTSINSCYRKHEDEKKTCIRVACTWSRALYFDSFSVLCNWGYGKAFYKRLASLLVDKWEQPYNSTLCWLRCHISFSLLWSAIQCIRGAHSSRGHASQFLLLTWSTRKHKYAQLEFDLLMLSIILFRIWIYILCSFLSAVHCFVL